MVPWIGLTELFRDRYDAGKQLAKQLFRYADDNSVVLALPRGGVPIGFEIATLLHLPLDVLIARKIGLPNRPELGIGAIAEGGVRLFDEKTLETLKMSPKDLNEVLLEETEELERRRKLYRGTIKLPDAKDRTVILVDDGLATGVTARAAIEGIKKLQPKKIIFASPVCANDSVQELNNLVDVVLCLATPLEFTAVGRWYRHFDQIQDEEVIDLLKKNKQQLKKSKSHMDKHHTEPEALVN